MSEPFIGELKLVPYNFAPRGWAACNGQILSIAQNTALFSLLGTTYGGNGETTFALPDLRGRVPLHMGQGPGLSNYALGQLGGEESHTLINAEMPAHGHTVQAAATGNTNTPAGSVMAATRKNKYATAPDGVTPMDEQMITPSGGNQPHTNVQPYLTLQWIIALEGIYPSRN
jgi:microcystin-dependent protein